MVPPQAYRKAAILLALLPLACSTPLGALRTARVIQPGHVEISAGASQNYPVGAYSRLYGPATARAKTIYKDVVKNHQISISPEQDVYVAVGEALSLQGLPQLITEVDVRAGIFPRFDLAARFTGSTWRGELFGQVYTQGPWSISAGVGGAYRGFSDSFAGVLDSFGLLSFSEWDVDATVLAGGDWPLGSFYFGPKAVFSKYDTHGRLTGSNDIHIDVLGNKIDSSVPLHLDLSQSWLVGAVIGGRVGYGFVFLTAELGIYESLYTPTVLGQQAKMSGLILYPLLGVNLRF